MQPSTIKRKGSILEALSVDGLIDVELLKEISRGCLEGLKRRHADEKCQSFLKFIRI